jgi:hypothetical protein
LCVIKKKKKVNELLTSAVMLRLAHGIVHTSHGNANRFKERTKVSVSAFGMNHTENNGCESLTFLSIFVTCIIASFS